MVVKSTVYNPYRPINTTMQSKQIPEQQRKGEQIPRTQPPQKQAQHCSAQIIYCLRDTRSTKRRQCVQTCKLKKSKYKIIKFVSPKDMVVKLTLYNPYHPLNITNPSQQLSYKRKMPKNSRKKLTLMSARYRVPEKMESCTPLLHNKRTKQHLTAGKYKGRLFTRTKKDHLPGQLYRNQKHKVNPLDLERRKTRKSTETEKPVLFSTCSSNNSLTRSHPQWPQAFTHTP